MSFQPPFQPVYAIGDIHGRMDALRETHDLIAQDGGEDAHIVHLGDLIDRGPESPAVIDHLMEGLAQGRNWQIVKGNHDNKLPRFLEDPGWIDPGTTSGLTWIGDARNGAAATLLSYGIKDADTRPQDDVQAEALRNIPAEHALFLDGLAPYVLHPGGFLFVHAGIRPGIDLSAQSRVDMMWIRKPFLESSDDHGALVVHGHTAIRAATHYGNRLNIDSGAGYGHPASAVRLDAEGAWLLTTTGPQRLLPEVAA
ncbi:MAG TPA: metallophosphoesterase [Paracoccus sp. (in: a-proteobacteria)]|uniref:metallophosphoesterase n=1 Tax=uncultured Paracoccus sp. TaxID=189685 RepID=UPI0026356AC3|nr:metallophosphoesterase [uncultured Paracoccus sp.]HMQ42167.1 metallophosphoesterase [Paracoccus sp. (in: a-proteobacteria)]HMR37171.1 metallophosphoesterase [Paracoccus sp. (in: a-proteobacteria)]